PVPGVRPTPAPRGGRARTRARAPGAAAGQRASRCGSPAGRDDAGDRAPAAPPGPRRRPRAAPRGAHGGGLPRLRRSLRGVDIVSKMRLLLVDDHTVVRQGLRRILESDDEIEIAGEASDGRTAVEMARRIQPQVVVMDIALPELNGIEATRQIAKRVD